MISNFKRITKEFFNIKDFYFSFFNMKLYVKKNFAKNVIIKLVRNLLTNKHS